MKRRIADRCNTDVYDDQALLVYWSWAARCGLDFRGEDIDYQEQPIKNQSRNRRGKGASRKGRERDEEGEREGVPRKDRRTRQRTRREKDL